MKASPQLIVPRPAVDPITLEVIRHGIVSITDQIDANIARTAFSPYIYEYKDFAVGLVSADGELIAQCTGGMPVFVADSVGMAVRDGLAVYGRKRLQHGDVLLCNHAAIQGQHLNNTVMYTPIYAGASRGSLVGFFAINVHWIDIGGITPRSSDIFMEGLQLRSIKLWSEGEPIQEVYRIIENNTRFPVELLGDIAAQHAGCILGRDLTQRLAEKYGVETFLAVVKAMLDQSEAAARERIRRIPDGQYSYETFFDNDGETDDALPIRVKVIIEGDEMTVDYSGIAEQVRGCINSGYYGGGRTTARVAFKYLIANEEPANEGTFRPLKLILPEGKILSAHPTAPMGNYSQPFPTVIDAIIKALEHALPERVTGAHFGTFSGVRFRGKRDNGTPFDCHDSGHGGWGACATHDGAGPFRTMAHGDTRIIPVELQESMYPYRIVEFSLRENSGGPGRFRGGLGYRKRYEILGHCDLQAMFDRVKYPPWGVHGGKAGQSGQITVIKKSGEQEILYKSKAYSLEPGDSIIVETGGGGYGSPHDRKRELLERDLRRGYVSVEAARRDYRIAMERTR
ncbi:MAG TPA: hydantoinase B/oxoprolinase family protein [Candidatus Binatia bacterium]|nr:hydantoinase B/oxoprolinase family protein [Candidatus Binatia bacterium]